ncbi:unnamed protein product, partial [marine sediment metagenome]
NFNNKRDVDLDRLEIFNENSRDKTDNDDNYDISKKWKKKFGEITGKQFTKNIPDPGMPLRGSYEFTKKSDDTYKENDRLDFDMFDPDENSVNEEEEEEIDYYNPVGNASSVYSDIATSTEKVMPELYGTDPGTFISSNINKFSTQIFDVLQSGLQNGFCISPYGIFNLFGSLYWTNVFLFVV